MKTVYCVAAHRGGTSDPIDNLIRGAEFKSREEAEAYVRDNERGWVRPWALSIVEIPVRDAVTVERVDDSEALSPAKRWTIDVEGIGLVRVGLTRGRRVRLAFGGGWGYRWDCWIALPGEGSRFGDGRGSDTAGSILKMFGIRIRMLKSKTWSAS